MVMQFEREILAELKKLLCNSKLRHKDLIEWSSDPLKPHDGEVHVQVVLHGKTWYCAVAGAVDKRK